jgi:hypothetical protein
MSAINTGRRQFVKGSSAVAGSLVVGFHVPFLKDANAQAITSTTPEINAWVVIQPDDRVVVRIALKNSNVIGQRSPPSTRRPAKVLHANVHGAVLVPAAARVFAAHKITFARAARPHA